MSVANIEEWNLHAILVNFKNTKKLVKVDLRLLYTIFGCLHARRDKIYGCYYDTTIPIVTITYVTVSANLNNSNRSLNGIVDKSALHWKLDGTKY